MSTKTILVTGVAGFIGFSYALRALEQGHHVIGIDKVPFIDDETAEFVQRLPYIRLSKLIQHPNFLYYKHDLTTELPQLPYPPEMEPDYIIHMAGSSGVRQSSKDPIAYINNNVVAFVNVLEWARLRNVKHVIYASSSSVYGNMSRLPFYEDDEHTSTQSIYASTKKMMEMMADNYRHQGVHFSLTGLRMFTVYGPYGRPNMIPWIITSAFLSNQPAQLHGRGKWQRDFTHVGDVVHTIDALLDVDYPPAVVNVGTGIVTSGNLLLQYVLESIERNCGYLVTPGIQYVDIVNEMPQCDLMVTRAHTALLRSITQRPFKPIEVGIYEFVKWYLTAVPTNIKKETR